MSLHFKDFLRKDTEKVFFNLEEFAEIHLIDNRPMPIVIDNAKLSKMQDSGVVADGIFEGEVMIHVKKKEFVNCPRIGSPMKIDNQKYIIYDIKDLEDTYRIVLGANEERSPSIFGRR